jgi:hypothetical protein
MIRVSQLPHVYSPAIGTSQARISPFRYTRGMGTDSAQKYTTACNKCASFACALKFAFYALTILFFLHSIGDSHARSGFGTCSNNLEDQPN